MTGYAELSSRFDSARLRDIGLLVVRVGFGLGFAWFHGWPKLSGGPERWTGTGSAIAHFGIGFGHEFWGLAAALAETLGGVLLALGLFYRPAVASLLAVMVVATTTHIVTGQGSPGHSLKNAFLFAGLLLVGPGRYSLDAVMTRKWHTWRAARAVLGLWVLLPVVVQGQAGSGTPQIIVQREARLSEPGRPGSLVEPALAVHPRNPGHLVAAGMWITAPTPFDTSQRCVLFASRDGGTTWKATAELIPRCGDPFLGIGANGTAHFVALGQSGMVAHRSVDGGTTWITSGLALGRNYDHPTLVVGPPPATDLPGPVYIFAVQGVHSRGTGMRFRVSVARSDDNGATYVRMPPVIPHNLNLNTLTVATTSAGGLVLPFFDFNRSPVPNEEEPPRLERPRAWVLSSADRGATLSEPRLITEQCLPHQGGFPILVSDPESERFRDRLYFACRTRVGLSVLHSPDGGEHWSEPVPIADDAGQDPDRVWPATGLAVSPAGVLAVMWQDRRDDAARQCQRAYVAASVDGGVSFSPPVAISSARSCPTAMADSAIARRFPGGGDYGSLVADREGRFHAVWGDARNGRFQLWTAMFSVREASGGVNR